MSEKLKQMFGDGWYHLLKDYLGSVSFRNIGERLYRMSKDKVEITPRFPDTFRAFKECPLNAFHSVVLGMDPYPGRVPNTVHYVADGLAFSSRNSVTCPKSLQYIFHAIDEDIYGKAGYYPENFDLKRWANQGILLLNCALSLPMGEKAGAHIELWSDFITYVLQSINKERSGIGFILMGSYARNYKKLLTNDTFGIYECEHPSRANYTGKWDHNKVFLGLKGYQKMMNNIDIVW